MGEDIDENVASINPFATQDFSEPDKKRESIVVFTNKDVEFLEALNGSCSWFLSQKRASKCDYVICTRNKNHLTSLDDKYEDRSAFLIGKITTIKPSLNHLDVGRKMIEFKKYALFDKQGHKAEHMKDWEKGIKHFWDKISEGNRIATRYVPTERIKEMLGIKSFANDLHWEDELDGRNDIYVEAKFDEENLYYYSNLPKREKKKRRKNFISITEAISEAKKSLSEDLDILEENIEIIIKG